MQLKTMSSLALAFTLALGSGTLFAQEAAQKASKPMTAQQQRMVECNKEATGKTGDERKAFMSTCLKGHETATAPMSQQAKMKACNADATAKSLKGDARKTFMSTCLKGESSMAHH